MLFRPEILTGQPLIAVLITLVALSFVLVTASNNLIGSQRALARPLRSVALSFVPTALFLILLLNVLGVSATGRPARIVETLLGIQAIWIVVTLVKAIILARAEQGNWQERVPGLFLDLIRIGLVLLGSMVVVALVWNKDLSTMLTTLGVGSLVLGLALQETLGNLFAGISLLFESSFRVGDWIKVGELTGQVIETSWRSVRLHTREHVMVILPNSVIGREKIENFSRPTKTVAIKPTVSFSYDDPPNKVKQVLLDVLKETPGVLSDPRPIIRTSNFADSAVVYECRFFIDRFQDLPNIEEDFKTRVWYSARRHGLSIPYPIRTVLKTEIPFIQKKTKNSEVLDLLERIAILSPLSAQERQELAHDALLLSFGKDEFVVEAGDDSQSLYGVLSGEARVTVKPSEQSVCEVGRLKAGDFFGEMAFLTGETRVATVGAVGDLEVVEIPRDAMRRILGARPELMEKIATIAEERRSALASAKASSSAAIPSPHGHESMLVRMKAFFGLH